MMPRLTEKQRQVVHKWVYALPFGKALSLWVLKRTVSLLAQVKDNHRSVSVVGYLVIKS